MKIGKIVAFDSIVVLLVLAYASPGLSSESEDEAALPVDSHLRSPKKLIDAYTVRSRKGVETSELLLLVRSHWATLREKGLAAPSPILILLDDADTVKYVFKWKALESRGAARADGDFRKLMKQLERKCVLAENVGLREVYQGFDYRRFPDIGGIELLKGKCASTIRLKESKKEVEVNVLNGFVLMHRSPGRDTDDDDGSREMYVSIIAHGGDFANNPDAKENDGELKILRVGQNKDLPQYGLIRAHGMRRDFPATAMWVVHWRIWTNKGTLITDPETPLVFGPTTVQHYPPVGTEFFSKTGPVKLIHEASGQVVASLTPKELTAFDIVVTKDDEIESIVLNKAPKELIDLFNKYTQKKATKPPARTEKRATRGGED